MSNQDDNKNNNNAPVVAGHRDVHVDVIIPVHNAETTIEDAVTSATCQEIPEHLKSAFTNYRLHITVCCYDDGSTDDSWSILQRMQNKLREARVDLLKQPQQQLQHVISTNMYIQKSPNGTARGAGFARNRAIELNSKDNNDDNDTLHFLCLLDSDDTMHCTRVAEQAAYMLQLSPNDRYKTLLGCTFCRDPPDSTWHYAQWANSLNDERLLLERFREVTILQPTWFLSRQRWYDLGGYVESPPPPPQQHDATTKPTASTNTTTTTTIRDLVMIQQDNTKYNNKLIHPIHDDMETIRLAEDIRFFHDHLHAGGLVKKLQHRTKVPLVTYRHSGSSQSFRTSRKLLLQLRLLALERSILRGTSPQWSSTNQDNGQFVIWGAGRDGKDFVKTLSADLRHRVYCFVDLDEKKLAIGKYVNRDIQQVHDNDGIPIVHFSFLARNTETRLQLQRQWEQGINETTAILQPNGRIDKSRTDTIVPNDDMERQEIRSLSKKQKTTKRKLDSLGLDLEKLQRLPVVVCVAMYRTNGALERNVQSIGRKEGVDLWHFN